MWLIGKVTKHLFSAINLSVAVPVQDQPRVITVSGCPRHRFLFAITAHVKHDAVISIGKRKAVTFNVNQNWRWKTAAACSAIDRSWRTTIREGAIIIGPITIAASIRYDVRNTTSVAARCVCWITITSLSLIHISEPTRLLS